MMELSARLATSLGLESLNARVALAMGTIVSLMLSRRNYWSVSVYCIGQWIDVPLRLGQVIIFYSPEQRPIGYLVWASFSPDVKRKFIEDQGVLLHFSEWNEGVEVWITDLCVAPGYAPYVLRHVRDQFQPETAVHWVRRTNSGFVRKVMVRPARRPKA